LQVWIRFYTTEFYIIRKEESIKLFTMNHEYRVLIPALLLVTMLIGSVSAPACPDIPDPPYVPEFPEEDIIKVEAYIGTIITSTTTVAATTENKITPVAQSLRPIVNGRVLVLTVTFAAPTPPADKGILILVTMLEGTPPSEVVLGCETILDPSLTTYTLYLPITINGGIPSIAVYASLAEVVATDRAPNDGFYRITSVSSTNPNTFHDDAPVGGITVPVNKLEVLAPYIALAAGLIITISAIEIKKRKQVQTSI